MMKCAEYYLDNHKIEVYNSMYGKVKVLLDGINISEKYAIFGSEHFFSLGGNNYSLQLGGTMKIKGRYIQIRKNGIPIALKEPFTVNTVRVYLFTIALGLILGFLLGTSIYEILWPAQ